MGEGLTMSAGVAWNESQWGSMPRNQRQREQDDRWAAFRAAIGRAKTIRRVLVLSDEVTRQRAERLIGPQHIEHLQRLAIAKLAALRLAAASN